MCLYDSYFAIIYIETFELGRGCYKNYKINLNCQVCFTILEIGRNILDLFGIFL